MWPRWCSGRRRARPWGRAAVCAGGRRVQPCGRAAVCAGGRRAQPWGRAAAWRAAPSCVLLLVAQLWLSISNFARNSPVSSSILESASLELQRFRVVSKNDRGKLRAKFVWAGTSIAHRYRGRVLRALRRTPHQCGLCLWASHYSSSLRSTRPARRTAISHVIPL